MAMFLRCLLVALVAAGAAARSDNTGKTAVQLAFEKYNLVPYPVKVAPKYFLSVLHPSGAMPILGNEIKLSQVQDEAFISYPADCKNLYTSLMFDADYEKGSKQYLHILVVNIPGNQVDKGQIIVEYEAPQLEKGSGYHRYTGVAYKQPGKIQEKNWSDIVDRGSFCLSEFVEKYRLGYPVAGSFFRGRYEEDCSDAH